MSELDGSQPRVTSLVCQVQQFCAVCINYAISYTYVVMYSYFTVHESTLN